ncbi:MAG: hypothetical protein JWN67_4141 [Actinomycetia bacterium]|nr:hypothetical protein [Actinomycetes bacterium]
MLEEANRLIGHVPLGVDCEVVASKCQSALIFRLEPRIQQSRLYAVRVVEHIYVAREFLRRGEAPVQPDIATPCLMQSCQSLTQPIEEDSPLLVATETVDHLNPGGSMFTRWKKPIIGEGR